MLQSMRERLQGIIATAIIVLVSLTFAIWGIQYYIRGRGGQNLVAKINGTKITREQLQTVYERARQGIMARMGKKFSFDQQTQARLRKQVLQQLIDAEVLFHYAQKLRPDGWHATN